LHKNILDCMLLCMRTTVDINDELLRQVKRLAADENLSFKQLVERALRELVSNRSPNRGDYKLRWRTEQGRLIPGVRIEDRDSLFDRMGER